MESGVYTLKIIRVIRAKKQPDKLAVNPYNIPNMMKTLIHTLLPAALLLLTATACEDTLTTPAATIGHGDGPTLTLVLDNNEEKAGTRSTLNDGAPVNHVETVRILVFQGTGDNATYVGEEVYADNATAINWPTTEDGKEKLDKITYQMNYAFVEGETYTLLGVGQDDKFAETYEVDLTGTTLANAYAKLQSNKTKDNIAQCDFYTGTTTFTHEGKNTHIDDLLMKRRVAGVMLYVTEIPQSLTDENNNNNDNYRVTSIRVCLGGDANQKSSVRLQRDFENWDKEPDGQTTLDNSNVVAEITGLEDWTWTDNADFYMEENNIKTARTGVYMLPLNATEDEQPTFIVKMYGKKLSSTDTDGTTEGEEVELSKSFTVEQRDDDGKSVTSFPIRSNYLYSIGKYNPAEGVDEPISLSGSPIYLEVLPFQKLDVNHEFGEARVQALFNPDFNEETKIFNCMNEVIPIKILPPLTTIRDRVKAIRIGIVDNYQTTVIDQDGKEVTETEEYYNNWLYVEANSNNTTIYRKDLDITELVKDQEGEIKLLMLDYARPRKEWGWNIDGGDTQWNGDENVKNNINNDIRYTDIYLYTDLEWDRDGDGQISENEKSTRTDVLRIRQYNTITVYYKGWTTEDNIAYCGFSRYDYDEFNEDTQDCTWGWGYQDTDNSLVYTGIIANPVSQNTGSYSNGSANQIGITYMTTDAAFNAGWDACAIKRSNHPFKKIGTDGTLTTEPINYDYNYKKGLGWYLPAQFEMEGFIIMCADNTKLPLINGNVTENQKYWTSTLEDNNTSESTMTCTLKVENGSRSYQTVELERSGNACRIRQARKFSDYEGYGDQW